MTRLMADGAWLMADGTWHMADGGCSTHKSAAHRDAAHRHDAVTWPLRAVTVAWCYVAMPPTATCSSRGAGSGGSPIGWYQARRERAASR